MTASPACVCRELFQLGVRCFDIDIVTTADHQLLVAHPAAVQVSCKSYIAAVLIVQPHHRSCSKHVAQHACSDKASLKAVLVWQ